MPPVRLVIWTDLGRRGGAVELLQSAAFGFTELYPNITFTIKDESGGRLADRFQSAYRAAGPPDLIWTTADRVGEIAAMGLLMPVDALIDLNRYGSANVSAVSVRGRTWGVPLDARDRLGLSGTYLSLTRDLQGFWLTAALGFAEHAAAPTR